MFKECINWAVEEKRTFLRQSLQSRLIALYFDTKLYTDALSLGATLLKELKKLDDKYLLVEVRIWVSILYLDIGYYKKKKYKLNQPMICSLFYQASSLFKSHWFQVQLLESKTYHALGNLPKSRAALTSARTTANAIYCPPKLQAALDLQSGILHAADERDFKTAYSYFYEAFEGYDSIDSPKAVTGLKYMLLSKIILNTYVWFEWNFSHDHMI